MAIGCLEGLVAGEFQDIDEAVADGGIVFDDKNGGIGHGWIGHEWGGWVNPLDQQVYPKWGRMSVNRG